MIKQVIMVRGRVQGVGYRWAARSAANQLGISGSVRNEPDGTVRIDAEGEEGAVEAMAAWAWQGSPGAQVESVKISMAEPDGETGFEIRH